MSVLPQSEAEQTQDESALFTSHHKDLPVQSKATCFPIPALIALLKVSIKLKKQMHSLIPHISDSKHKIPVESLNFGEMERQKTRRLGSISALASRHNVRAG